MGGQIRRGGGGGGFRSEELKKDEAIEELPVAEDQPARRSESLAARRQRELVQKTLEDALRRGLEAQRTTTTVQARCLRRLSLRYFGGRLGSRPLRGKVLRAHFVFYLVSCKFLSLRGVFPWRPVTGPQGGLGAPSSPSPRGRLSHRLWGRRLLMTLILLLRRQERLRAGRLHRLWRIQGWRLPHTLLMLEAQLPLGMLEGRPPQRLLMSTPSALDLLGLRTWSGTSLKSTRRQEVREHLARRYFNLDLQARGCHDTQLIGIHPLAGGLV
jgi:hypothetical protein